MSRKPSGAPFSLFAFQDAITSVCGVVVLVTLLLAVSLTQRVVKEAESDAVAKSKADEVRAQVEALQNALKELDAQIAASIEVDSAGVGKSLPEVKAQLSNAKKRLEGARKEATGLDERLEELRKQESTFSETERRVEELRRQVEETLQKAEETSASEFDSRQSAVYSFSDAVREKPWFVEISGSTIVAHGSSDDAQNKTFSTPFEFTKWAATRNSGAEYFVLIVRPSGAKNYGFIVTELEESGYRYGVDLIGENKPLMFVSESGKETE